MNIDVKSLTQAIATASIALAKKASLPAYSQFRIESASGMLSMWATDGDQWSMGTVACNSAIDPFCVMAKSLTTLLPLLTENVWMDLKDNRLFITSGSKHFNLATSKAAEFPTWEDKGSKPYGLNCQDLAKAIEAVAFAASTDTANRAVLCSVQVKCKDKEISATGFNGRELAHYSMPAISAKCEFLLPQAMVKNFCKALNGDGAVFWLSDNKATVKHDAGEYSCKLWAGAYPKMDDFLKFKRNELGEINSALWLPILRSCIPDDDNKLCIRVIVADGMVLHTGPTTQMEVPTPDKLEKCELRLNGKALIPCLEQFKDKAKLSLVEGENAICMEHENLMVLSNMLVKNG